VPTILVADDNSNIQKMVSLIFKEKGVRVVAVGNGEAACRKVPEVHPDVVLADVFMPVRNGYEVCEFVKQDPQFAETPVILLVGAFDPLDEKEARRVGANGVLKKPFVPPEPLIAMVNSLLGKVEPPVEEAPAPVEVASPTPPPPPAVPAPPVREFATSSEEGNSDAGDEAVLAFGDPVATPSTKHQSVEEEDDSEPASEWARRRATMDYEIDSADSANMVEKLAAESTAADAEILASRKHLPFGGANVPEALSEAAPEPSPVKWPHFVAPESTAPESPATESEHALIAEEATAPTAVESPATSRWANMLPREPELERDQELPLQATAIDEAPSQEPVAAQEQEAAAAWSADLPPTESAAHSDDAAREVASAAWPPPEIAQEREAQFVEPQAAPPEESREPEIAPSFTEKRAVSQETVEKMFEPPLALPEVIGRVEDKEAERAQAEPVALEGPAEEAASKLQTDQATVDDMVAKVLSKLEPQLHQALANGVLRPLVEELLNQERDKK
jgi:CheY-like chemotaxis protein